MFVCWHGNAAKRMDRNGIPFQTLNGKARNWSQKLSNMSFREVSATTARQCQYWSITVQFKAEGYFGFIIRQISFYEQTAQNGRTKYAVAHCKISALSIATKYYFALGYGETRLSSYLIPSGTAQSVQRLATVWTARGSNLGGGEIFRTRPDRPWYSILQRVLDLFPEVACGEWRWPPIPIEGRVLRQCELHFYFSAWAFAHFY